VRGGVAVTGGVVIAGQIDGTVLGLDAGSGAVRWRYALAPDVSAQLRGWLYGPPTAGSGDVLVGVQSELADLDVTTGSPRWTANPITPTAYTQSLAAVALGGGLAIGELDRSTGGLVAWDRTTGAERWRIKNSSTIAIEASPVVANGNVFVENAADQVLALGLDGGLRWQVSLDPAGTEWSYETVGTPAYGSGMLVVPTLDRDLVGLDAATGAVRWRLAGTPSLLRTTHYRGAGQAGFEASPVITGDLVWAVDTAGQLTAATLASGKPRWQTSLGVPVLAGLAASGDWLVVASYDGTVRALTPAARELPALVAGNCNRSSGPERGCDASQAPESPVLPMLIVIALVAFRRRGG
jgi:outer membrane protein assembly factor BamB